MAKIAKNAAKLNAVQLGGKVQVSLTAIAAHATPFTGAATLLATGETQVDELDASHALVLWLIAQLAQARQAREIKRKEVLEYYDDLVRFVDGIAKGDANLILLAGMDVAAPPGPAQPMPKILDHRLVAGETEQTLLGSWPSEAGSRYYDVQVSSNPTDPASWVDYDSPVTASIVLEGQPSGQKRWTRVRAVNSVGKGPWSDPACAMVP
jgi:hypothetical protein